MTKIIYDKLRNSKQDEIVFTPVFFRLSNPEDRKSFEALLTDYPQLKVYDTIEDQLKELIKVYNPTVTLSKKEYSEKILEHLHGEEITDYGVWVYYPWSNKVVHLLDENEFVTLRTAANRNKITTAERTLLAEKKVGVIGLSVGQSVSLTLAMERGCGELRIADFDTLELNNLNRIRAGVHNLGILKAYVVAREIAEIDPYFKVVCYTEGINAENIHDFFTKGGPLNIVIDECDGVNIKILCRIKAKELGVPVLMEASDRGTVDVERFDLEPDRLIIHGWLEGLPLDFEILNNLKTSEEKLPYMLPISGMDTLSPRMKASMVEIQQTITTWPQLASAVALGGAITADTCRRIFLNQFTDSGRYFVDLEKLLPDTRPRSPYVSTMDPVAPITDHDVLMLVNNVELKDDESDFVPEISEIERMVEAAIKAPSAGNNQPWKWHFQGKRLYLFHDRVRSLSFGDYQDMASYVALGAAIENLQIAAFKMNIGIVLSPFEIKEKKLIAIIKFTRTINFNLLHRPEQLFSFINSRCTNRNLGKRLPISANVYQSLHEAVNSVSGARLFIKDDDQTLDALRDIISASERLRMLHPEGHMEFYEKELRWDDEHSKSTADGIDIATVDVTPSELVGLKLVKDPEVVKLLAEWRGGKALEKIAQKAINSASAVGLITMPEFSTSNFLKAGIAVERMWLTATEHKISMQPMLAATLHFARLNYGNGEGLPDFMKFEFGELHNKFINIFPEVVGSAEVFLFRLSIANEPKVKSYRQSINKVLTINKYNY
ncbi:MAG: Rv1355c family protein [Taibaiella sp.]|nr:Rv1355c family protein [Taibaiella sp.]